MKVLPSRVEKLALHVRDQQFSYGALLAGLYSATFCIRASFGLTVVLLSLYLPEDTAIYGTVIAVTPLAELIAVPFTGIANDRYGRRNILLTGLGIGAVSLMGRVFTRELAPHLVFNVLHGISAALILVTSLALLADWARDDARGREMGIFDFVTIFGWMVGFILGLIVKDLFAGRLWVGFIVAATLAGIGLAVAFGTVHEPTGARTQRSTSGLADLGHVAAKPAVALVVAPWLLIFTFIGGLSAFIERLTAAAGLSGLESALGLTLLTIVLLASQVGYGKLSDVYGRTPFILLGAWGFFAFTVTAAFLSLAVGSAAALEAGQLGGHMPLFGPFLALSFIAMLAFGPAALAALADEAQKGPSGVTMSLYSFVVGLGFIIGPVVTGTVLGLSGAPGLAVVLFVMGIGLVILVHLRTLLVTVLGRRGLA